MSGLPGTLLVLGLAWLAGAAGCWAWLRWGRPRRGDPLPGGGALALGYGYLLGLLTVTLLLRLWDALGWTLDFAPLAGLLAVLAGVGLWLGGWPGRWAPPRSLLWWLLLGWLGLRLGVLAWEAGLRPLYPWDAWATWAVKARVWAELGALVPFGDAAAWAEDRAYPLAAWHYPGTVPLIQVWLALGAGGWDDVWVNLAWPGCLGALGLAFYGQARNWGFNPLSALTGTWLLLSLPLLNVHTLLAGYADLWLAACHGLAAMALLLWLRDGDRRQGGLALLCLLALPLLKLEGTVWLLTFVPPLVVAVLGPRRGLLVGVGALAVFLAWYGLGGLVWEPAWPGRIEITPERLVLPYLGVFNLGYREVGWAFVRNLYLLENWHLLWYLAPLLLVVTARRWIADRVLLTGAVLLFSGALMLFVLFFYTDASQWAAQYTSLNRVLLHMVPALVFYLLVLAAELRPELRHTACLSRPRLAR